MNAPALPRGTTTVLVILASCALSLLIVYRFPMQILALCAAVLVVVVLARLLPAGGCQWVYGAGGYLSPGSVTLLVQSQGAPSQLCRLVSVGRGHDGTLVAKFEILSEKEKPRCAH